MTVEIFAHIGQGALSNDRLKISNQIFKAAGYYDCCQIDTAVNEQQIKREVLRLMVGERLFREVFGDTGAQND